VLYFFTIRGNLGIPTVDEIDNQLNASGQPFETSQERSRYAVILSLYNDRTTNIDKYPSIGTPDIGYINGHYYSFFPPGLSVLALPLYHLGLKVGATQLLAFITPTIFALLTVLLIFKMCEKLQLHWSSAMFAAFTFGFATNAWGYSVTLFAHLVSAFLLLSGLYAYLFFKKDSFLKLALIWTLYAVSVFVDFPNLFLFLPIAIAATFEGLLIKQTRQKLRIEFKLKNLLAPLIFVGLMGLYGYYNYMSFGKPTILSNMIPRVRDLKDVSLSAPEFKRSPFKVFQTRELVEGLRSFIISVDRGIVVFMPVVLLFMFGLAKYKRYKLSLLFFSIPALCLILYSMFSDPYGGWAFGSRYLIAVLPELCIVAAIGLDYFFRNVFVKIIYSLLFLYSTAISLMAPLTTNVIPPYVEARNLGLDYTYRINWKMLNNNELNSFVYNHILNKSIPGIYYYVAILVLVSLIGLILIWIPKQKTVEYENQN